MREAEKAVSRAKVRLLMAAPFFGNLLCQRPPEFTDVVDTAAVDTRGRLYVNPAFVETLAGDEVEFLLAHEVMHIVFQHALREGDRDHEVWNVAADAVINDMLKALGIGRMIKGGVEMAGAADRTAEDVYKELVAKGKAGGSKAKGKGKGKGGAIAGDLDTRGAKGMTEAEIAEITRETKRLVAGAMSAARAQGTVPGKLFGVIEPMLKDPVKWEEVLERFITSRAGQCPSWAHPNRRYRRVGYLPSLDPEATMGLVVIGIDTSGSVTDKELAGFLGQVNAIFERCHPTEVRVMYCDEEVEKEEVYTASDFPIRSVKVAGRGGTDMRAIFSRVEDEGLEPDAVLVFTDGWTPYPESEEYPTLWVTTDKEAPECAGESLRVGG
jgi:predicted metal-dependent peptidase